MSQRSTLFLRVTSFKFEIYTFSTYIIACESWRFVSSLKKLVRNEISKLHNWDQLHHNRYIDTDTVKNRVIKSVFQSMKSQMKVTRTVLHANCRQHSKYN